MKTLDIGRFAVDSLTHAPEGHVRLRCAVGDGWQACDRVHLHYDESDDNRIDLGEFPTDTRR